MKKRQEQPRDSLRCQVLRSHIYRKWQLLPLFPSNLLVHTHLRAIYMCIYERTEHYLSCPALRKPVTVCVWLLIYSGHSKPCRIFRTHNTTASILGLKVNLHVEQLSSCHGKCQTGTIHLFLGKK